MNKAKVKPYWEDAIFKASRGRHKTSECATIDNSQLKQMKSRWLSVEFEKNEKELYKDYDIGERFKRYLYVFYCPVTRFCKIGISDDWYRRRQDLQNKVGAEVSPLIVIELSHRQDPYCQELEKFLHDFFSKKRQSGEWFDLNIKDVIQIRSLIWRIHGDHIWDYVKRNAKIVSGETPNADFTWSYLG